MHFVLSPDDPNGLETIELSKLPGQPPYWFFDGVGDHCSKGASIGDITQIERD